MVGVAVPQINPSRVVSILEDTGHAPMRLDRFVDQQGQLPDSFSDLVKSQSLRGLESLHVFELARI